MRLHDVFVVGALALAIFIPREAAAHIEIVSHETRHGVANQKSAPCGLAGGTGPGANIYTYAPGETITLAWDEFIDHPGHYRVAFDDDGDDDFVDPASVDDLYNSPTVLLDGIADEPGVHDYQVDVALPDVECETCTIQILQIMTDKTPFGDGNDINYHCIDVRLVADGGDGDGDPGDGDGDGDGDPEPGDGDGDPGDGETETGEGESETGTPLEQTEAGCACAATPDRPLTAAPLGLLILGLVRRRRG